jgi:hypothetical protein
MAVTIPAKWPPGVMRLLDEAMFDIDEVLAGRKVSRAVALAASTGLPFQTTQFPMYFTGAFESPLVLVHLNPKFSKQMDNPGFRNFDEYVDGHRRFGHLHWEMEPDYKSQFDRKQIRFLRPFGVIDFLDESQPGHDRTNAARAIDQKRRSSLNSSRTPLLTFRLIAFPWKISALISSEFSA